MSQLYSFHDDEEINEEFLCPDGHPMTTGIRDPRGDYDDWLVMPHCSICDFEATSGKDPYRDCLPVNFVPETLKMGVFLSEPRSHDSRLLFQFSSYHDLPTGGPGGMWVGFLPLTEVERIPRESESGFWSRARSAAEDVLIEKKVEYKPEPFGLVGNSLLEDPVFYRFQQ